MPIFTVKYRPFRAPHETLTVIATAKPSPGTTPTLWYATAPGAGCSKDYNSARFAVSELVLADLGKIVSIEENV